MRWHRLAGLLAGAWLCTAPFGAASQTTADAEMQSVGSQGPIRLGTTPPRNVGPTDDATVPRVGSMDDGSLPDGRQRGTTQKPSPSEFEIYASELAGVPIQRLGSDLMLPSRNIASIEANRQVPPDYIVGLGDEIQLTIWGSVDADMRLTVDRAGRIVIPRVGPVVVAGMRHADLNELLTRRVGQVFKNFQLSATLGRLRSIRY